MNNVWTKGGVAAAPTAFIVEATDGESKFHLVLSDSFRIGEHTTLKALAQSYIEWSGDKETLRTVLLKQFNSGIQTGDELAFTMPLENGKLHTMERTADERDRDEADRSALGLEPDGAVTHDD